MASPLNYNSRTNATNKNEKNNSTFKFELRASPAIYGARASDWWKQCCYKMVANGNNRRDNRLPPLFRTDSE